MRGELWEVLVEMVESVDPGMGSDYGMHIRDITFDVPVEVITVATEVGFRLYVDIPRSRWQEGLAIQPGRMTVLLQERPDDHE